MPPPLFIMDMVHHNPGEPLFETSYNDPAAVGAAGFNAKAFFLFESPTLAIRWDGVEEDVFPAGSEPRAWVDNKADVIRQQHQACRAAGLKIYAQTDMVLLPQALIHARNLDERFGDPNDPETMELIRIQIRESFAQFPELDGLIMRIGETYLHDAPWHLGAIHNKDDVAHTIVPLMRLLREEVCVQQDRQLIFRSWLSFDCDLDDYLTISAAIEPHPNFIISVKHCEDDFHRSNPFSRVIGQGQHPQLIEVQCSREYEGKGAYPNYVAADVIDGFEEHRGKGLQIESIRAFSEQRPELFAGIWTWSRGGGWGGPYAANELWYDLNAWVMAQWARDTHQDEESVFWRYARERLGLPEDSVPFFRELCLLSGKAIVRMRNTTEGDLDLWWTRDAGIGWPEYRSDTPDSLRRSLAQKDEAVQIWEHMVSLAEQVQWPDPHLADFALGSVHYGLGLARIYRAIFYLDAARRNDDQQAIARELDRYDAAWRAYDGLPTRFAHLSDRYRKDYRRHIAHPADEVVNELRTRSAPESAQR